MSFLGGLLRHHPTATEPVAAAVDHFEGNNLARRWSECLARGEWQELSAFLRSFDDVETRDFYLRKLAGQLRDRPSWLDLWVEQEPDAALPRLFRGSHATAWGWAARGTGRAKSVNKDGWQRFFERLQAAESDLLAAASLDPNDAGPWMALLPVSRGLQQGQERQREVFEEAQRRRPWHQEACAQIIQCRAAKWSGSNEEILDLAHTILRDAPEGAGAHVAVAEAHLEVFFELGRHDSYWKRPEVRADIVAAASRSIGSPHYVATPYDVRNRNIFAFCFWKSDDLVQVQEQMTVVGGTVTFPWTRFFRPVTDFKEARHKAAAAQGRSGPV